MTTVISVNVGTPRDVHWATIGRTSIAKHPVAGPVHVGLLGIDGDQVSDLEHHGGLDQAVYAFAREDLDAWATDLGQDIPDGQFGENLTTLGIDVNEAEIGERWQVGEVLLEVRSHPDAVQRLQELDGPERVRRLGLGQALRPGRPPGAVPEGARSRAGPGR